jgi:hypothetical protein
MLLATLLLATLPLARPASHEGGSRDQAAIDAYRHGDFETAKSLWIAALDAGDAKLSKPERARILYDVGNAAYRKGDALEAVGWYTASIRLRPRDADAWKNLEQARVTAKLEPADRGDLAATLARLVGSLTRAESEWLAIAAVLVWAGVLAGEAFRGGRLLRRLALAGAFTTACALAPLVYHAIRDGRDTVLVLDPSERGAEIRSEPRADATVVGTVDSGTEVAKEDELPGWVKIAPPGSSSGWIPTKSAFALDR